MIPAAGYDAQCTTCNAVFFVAPEKSTTASTPLQGIGDDIADVNKLVSVTCSHCNAVYQFSASDIPAGGYDAQCTQCQSVFFVSPQAVQPASTQVLGQPSTRQAAAPTMPPGSSMVIPFDVGHPPNPHAPRDPGAASSGQTEVDMPEITIGEPESDFSDTVTRPGMMAPELVAQSSPPPDELMMSAQPVAPAELVPYPRPATEASPLAEPPMLTSGLIEITDPMVETKALERPMRLGLPPHLRRPALLGGAVAGGVVALCVVLYAALYFAAPRLFDRTFGRLVGVRLTLNPAAVPNVEKGRHLMMDDSDAAYSEALKEFDKALKIDDHYPDAIAGTALSHIFRGLDTQLDGRHLLDAVAADQAELKAQLALPPERQDAAAARVAELKRAIAARQDKATHLLEKGGKEVTSGKSILEQATVEFPKSPAIAEALAVWYTTDPELLGKADKALTQSVTLRGGEHAVADANEPADAWIPYIEAKVHRGAHEALDEARAAYLTALQKEPHFQRARWELAELLMEMGKKDEAKKLAHEIVASVPKHAKAQALLDLKSPAVAPATAPALEPLPSKDALAKNKSKAKGKKVRVKGRRPTAAP